jgi:hypothetical protein
MLLIKTKDNTLNNINKKNKFIDFEKKSRSLSKYWNKKFDTPAENSQCPNTTPITNSLPWNRGINSLRKNI